MRIDDALRALAEAAIPVLAFELEGARLSDAFLAMTGAAEWRPSTAPGRRRGRRRWASSAGQELRDLWLGGRGLLLAFAFSVLLSVIAYLAATNQALNFLEQREAVNLTLQVAVAVGALLALLVAADAISGERERGTLESLLLTPASRGGLAAGKLLAALSLWLAAFVVTVPYVWFLGPRRRRRRRRGGAGCVVGTLLAVVLGALGIVVSALRAARTASASRSACSSLLALFAPTQLPAGAQQGWAGELLLRVNPVTAGEHYIGKSSSTAHGWSRDAAGSSSPDRRGRRCWRSSAIVAPRFAHARGGGRR